MPAPFQVRDGDRPGDDLGEWTEDGDITIPGRLTAGELSGAAGEIVFAAMVAAFVTVASTDTALTVQVTGDTDPRLAIDAEGQLSWGDGAGAADTNLYRSAAGILRTDDSLEIGQGLRVVDTGAGPTMGRATLVSGGATVNTTAITATSNVFMTVQVPAGSVGAPRVASLVAGTSFTIASSQGTDGSTVAWFLVEPA